MISNKEKELLKKEAPHTKRDAASDNSELSRTTVTDNISKNKEKINCGKKRNWACVVYPESLPENWLELLTLTGLQVAISPLHDKDLEADGQSPKKPHYHLILIYGNPTTYNNVKNLTDKLNAPRPIPLEQVRGYYRYLTHKDNPEKYQYDEKDIKTLNGFSVLDFVELTTSEVDEISKNLLALIREKTILEYSDFVDYVMNNLSNNDFNVAINHTFFFNTYITSYRNSTLQRMRISKYPDENKPTDDDKSTDR